MTFTDYLRWDGAIAVVVGAGLFAFGLAEGHQGALDAIFNGGIMLAGTAVFMMLRHKLPFRRPGTWFTSTPLARAEPDREPRAPLGLSYLTGFWLTYMGCGVWAIAVGAIKVGPARAAIATHEASAGTIHHVAGRPLRGLVDLSASPTARSGPVAQADHEPG